jgi:hypothetical protein|tara:strand:- start:28767 stop:28886 length:120 start_codon:yes stop_codon:yes gene_type:complete
MNVNGLGEETVEEAYDRLRLANKIRELLELEEELDIEIL